MSSDAPPLPWGHADNAAEETQDCKLISLPLTDAGLATGDTIEVKWTVSNDEGADVTKWWVAKVIGPSTLVEEDDEVGREADPLSHPESHSQDKKDAPVMLEEVPLDLTHQFAVKYERGGEGFEEEEEAVVAFLSDHWLYDVDKGFELAFRKLGDTWEPKEDEEEADGAAVISISSFSGEEERARNREILAAASDSLMEGLDPFRQRLVAGGIAQLTEVLGSMIRSKQEGSVITREDVEEAFRGKKPRL